MPRAPGPRGTERVGESNRLREREDVRACVQSRRLPQRDEETDGPYWRDHRCECAIERDRIALKRRPVRVGRRRMRARVPGCDERRTRDDNPVRVASEPNRRGSVRTRNRAAGSQDGERQQSGSHPTPWPGPITCGIVSDPLERSPVIGATRSGRRGTAIVNLMVQYPATVDRAFAAIADPTRRAVLERLGAGTATISELAEPFGMSLTGMKKHIRLLEEAELVTTEKVGRARRCMLAPYAFEGISMWLQRLDRFAQVVERTKGAR